MNFHPHKCLCFKIVDIPSLDYTKFRNCAEILQLYVICSACRNIPFAKL
jgi:hypothetical protein